MVTTDRQGRISSMSATDSAPPQIIFLGSLVSRFLRVPSGVDRVLFLGPWWRAATKREKESAIYANGVQERPSASLIGRWTSTGRSLELLLLLLMTQQCTAATPAPFSLRRQRATRGQHPPLAQEKPNTHLVPTASRTIKRSMGVRWDRHNSMAHSHTHTHIGTHALARGITSEAAVDELEPARRSCRGYVRTRLRRSTAARPSLAPIAGQTWPRLNAALSFSSADW